MRDDAMRDAVLESAEHDSLIYAECGGLIFATRSLTLERGRLGRDSARSSAYLRCVCGD